MRHSRVGHRAISLTLALLVSLPLSAVPPAVASQAVAIQNEYDEQDDDAQFRVDFPATITRIDGPLEVEVRGGNGRTYKVECSPNSRRFEVGAPIRVVGIAEGMDVKAAFLVERTATTPLSGPQRYQSATEVDFPAEIIGIDKDNTRALVRGEDGKEYRLRGDELEEFEVGDHVQVQGVSRYGVVELRTLELLP